MKEYLKIHRTKLSILFTVSIIVAFSSHLTLAGAFTKPDKCPDVGAIREVGVDYIVLGKNGIWAASNLNNKYGTGYDWTLSLGGTNEKVKDEAEAKQKAKQELQTLIFVGGPYYSGNGDTACLYDTNKIKGAMTITPPLRPPHHNILFKR